ncbi:MAG TPA: tetratricopeptide repeat protein [Xanthobacteraceae bacterium]|nr:tetratricopeptide repeat protein [Xanthobacteraceae bacterium]
MLLRFFSLLALALLLMGQSNPQGNPLAKPQAKADPQALYKAGYDARVAGHYDDAIRLLSAAIASGKLNDDDRATSYNNRGMAYAATGAPDKAVADYSMAIKIAPVYGPAYLNRGNVFLDAGKYDEAIADFNRAIITFPGYALAYNSRGAAYYSKGNLNAALADLDTAIKLKPDYGNAYWNRARVYASGGDNAKALADLNQAIRFKPQEADMYDERGVIRSVGNDDNGAVADFTKAIELDAKMASAFNHRGNSYFALGKIDAALADYDSAIRIEPDFSDPYTNRGRIELFHRNRPADAANDLSNGVRLDPKDIYGVLWLHIARTRTGTADHDELVGNAAKFDDRSWPRPLLDLFLGKTTPEDVRHAAGKADEHCEADFYLGEFDLEKNARDEAKKLITAAAKGCSADMLEKSAASAELARLSQ